MDFDIVIIGAGIAGATAAAHLSPHRRVALIEAEESAGYHTTGRSAALWVQNYGPPDVRELSRLSRAFFENPPQGFTATPLMRRRAVLLVATEAQLPDLDAALAEGIGLRRVTAAEAKQMLPAIRPGAIAAGAMEDDAFDMDVAAIHQGFLRQLRENGGILALRHRAGKIERRGVQWQVETTTGETVRAPVVVNAAGAWGDEIAALAGVAPLGLTPKRRTAAIVDPAPHDPENWPMVCDVKEKWYARPEARTRLMVSPADETQSTRTTSGRRNTTSRSASTGCSKSWTSKSAGSSTNGPACALSRRMAVWRSAGTRGWKIFSGASGRAVTVSKPPPPRGSWSPIWCWVATLGKPPA